MDDYIKRDDVIDLLEQVMNAEEFFDTDNAKAQSDLALWFEERISELPKADVVEVVRCKDCKYKKSCCQNVITDPDWCIPEQIEYCSCGEKEEEHE